MRHVRKRLFTRVLLTIMLSTILIACGGTTTTNPDPKPTDPQESFKSVATLTASDAAANDEFGNAVAISGNYAIVGAYRNDDTGRNSGSAYIYSLSGETWTQVNKLSVSDEAAGNFLANSVDIVGDYAIAGSLYNNADAVDSGAAYIFKRNGTNWLESVKLTASNAKASDYFGSSVALSENHAIVGATSTDENGSNSGSAYIFQRNGDSWTEVSKLTASDGKVQDLFGTSVAIYGDYAAVGAFTSDTGPKSGAVYIYKRNANTWSELTKLTANDANADDRFGDDVVISEDYLVVAAPN